MLDLLCKHYCLGFVLAGSLIESNVEKDIFV